MTNSNTTNRLATIANRQRGTRVRDAFFAACVALAAIISITSVGTACHAANTAQTTHR